MIYSKILNRRSPTPERQRTHMMKKHSLFLLGLFIASLACNLPVSQTPSSPIQIEPTPIPIPTSTTAPSVKPPDLTHHPFWFGPLPPLPAVLPRPEPMPRPTRLVFFQAPNLPANSLRRMANSLLPPTASPGPVLLLRPPEGGIRGSQRSLGPAQLRRN